MFSFNPSSSLVGKQWISLATQCVGVGPGGTQSMLARVSLVDFRGNTVLDTYVQPTSPVVNHWVEHTGITQKDLTNGLPFANVQAAVFACVRGKIIVGHRLWEDFSALGLVHPAFQTRDTALYLPFRTAGSDVIMALPLLIQGLMRHEIAIENQDALENARACMDLYRSSPEWEISIDQDDMWNCALPPEDYRNFYL